MTVRELIAKLSDLPQDLPVEIYGEADCGHVWGGGKELAVRHLDADSYDWLELDNSVVRLYAFEEEPHPIMGVDASSIYQHQHKLAVLRAMGLA